MDFKNLKNKLEAYLEPVLDKSGAILFSSANTLVPGDLYTLGLNPGGEFHKPIKEIIDELPSKTRNAYINENWGNRKNSSYEKGQHPLQKNYVGLLKSLEYDPTQVFSSNLIFTRSRDQKGANYPTNADICWKAHQEFIKIVDPKCFIVFGNSKISPFQYIKNRYSLEKDDVRESGHGKWKCYSYKGIIEGKERLLIGVPHLSRYYIIYHNEVIDWIKSIIQGTNRAQYLVE